MPILFIACAWLALHASDVGWGMSETERVPYVTPQALGALRPGHATACANMRARDCAIQAPGAVEYERVVGGGSVYRPVGLCELVQTSAGVGVYRVDSLVGQIEPDVRYGGTTGFTYVDLSLLEGWTQDAPPRAVARLRGGPMADGGTQSWDVWLTEGESLLIFLQPASADNLGYYHLTEPALWRMTATGGLTNGFLFADERVNSVSLRAMVEAIAGAATQCPIDAFVGFPVARPRPRSADQVNEGAVAGVRLDD